MLSHSFDQFYIVTKFELPKTKDLKLTTFRFDFECSYANHMSTSNTDYVRLMNYCLKLPHMPDSTRDRYNTTIRQPMTH